MTEKSIAEPRPHRRSWLLAALVAALPLSCSGSESGLERAASGLFSADPPTAPAAYSAWVDARTGEMDWVRGQWEAGDAQSRFKAFMVGEEPVLVAESLDLGDYGEERARYYFSGGVLLHCRQFKLLRDLSPPAPGRPDEVAVIMSFDLDGRLSEYTKTVNGQAVTLEGWEAGAALRHAEMLLERAAGAARH
jgi:hypothetical protein